METLISTSCIRSDIEQLEGGNYFVKQRCFSSYFLKTPSSKGNALLVLLNPYNSLQVLDISTLGVMIFAGLFVTLLVRNVLIITGNIILDATHYEPCYDPVLLLSFRKAMEGQRGGLRYFLCLSHFLSGFLVYYISGKKKEEEEDEDEDEEEKHSLLPC